MRSVAHTPLFSGTMDYDYPPDAPDYDDLEDLLDDLEQEKQLVIDDAGMSVAFQRAFPCSACSYIIN